jgi:hypothetical protein
MKKKATIGGASPKPAKNTTGATNRTSGYLNPKAAGNRNATPKTYTTTTKSGIKITASGSSSGGGTGNKSVKPGSMATQTKVVKDKPAAPKKMTPALKAKVDKAISQSQGASLRLSLVKEAAKLGNLNGPGVKARMLKEANQSDLDKGRTASRAKNIISKYKKK